MSKFRDSGLRKTVDPYHPTVVAKDKRLSWEAKGIYFIVACTDECTVQMIYEWSNEIERESIDSALRELISVNLIQDNIEWENYE